ncbi:MAG: 16S rRNA (guanine(527)-N(7))-methyltransferase RsmG [Acidobacteria bacterium]|nr:16S rRNA (guanine(527)-N(7))-methyltransferase RsmG [Acidobacteriota bacterium]
MNDDFEFALNLINKSNLYKTSLINPGQVEKLSHYAALIMKWNNKINLTGLKNIESVVNTLILDSLHCLELLPDSGSLVDIGSGAGIPGLVLKIVRPNIRVSLVEPRFKKTVFLKNVVSELHLESVRIINSDFNAALNGHLIPESSLDYITIRALRLDNDLLQDIVFSLNNNGLLFLHNAAEPTTKDTLIDSGFKLVDEEKSDNRDKPLLQVYSLEK